MKFVALSFFVVVCFSAYVGSQTTTTKPAVTTTKTTPKLTTKTTPRLTTKTTTRLTTKTTPRLTTKTTPRVTTKTTPKLTTKTTTKTTTMPKTTKPTNTSSYCNIDTCPVPSEHILCVYLNTSWGAACGIPNPNKSSISAEDIRFIVSIHNRFRRIIAYGEVPYGETRTQLPASNMRQLMWDDELAVIAQTHAQQCVDEYDACRDVSRFPVGQNSLMMGSGDGLVPPIFQWATVVLIWFFDYLNMSAAYVSSFPVNPPKAIDRYTQLAWATTYTVGCGVARYYSTNNSMAPFRYHFVCNYGPAGNVINSSVYSVGAPGSACPAPTSNVDGLCAL